MIEVGMMTKDAMERAYKLRHTELRARALVDSAVAFALQNKGEPEDRDFREYAYEIATNAAAMLMQYIYEGDAELKAIRVERDHYKKIAEAHLQFAPPFLALSDSDTHPKDGDVKQAPLVSGAAIAQKEVS